MGDDVQAAAVRCVMVEIHGIGNQPADWSAEFDRQVLAKLDQVAPTARSAFVARPVWWADLSRLPLLPADAVAGAGGSAATTYGLVYQQYAVYLAAQLAATRPAGADALDFSLGDLSGLARRVIGEVAGGTVSIGDGANDVANYISDNGVRAAVQQRLSDAMFQVRRDYPNASLILASHSQGTIIAYDVLRLAGAQLGDLTWVTMGCPLGWYLNFARWGGEPLGVRPATVWHNLFDPGDIVGKSLDGLVRWEQPKPQDRNVDNRGHGLDAHDHWRNPAVVDFYVDLIARATAGTDTGTGTGTPDREPAAGPADAERRVVVTARAAAPAEAVALTADAVEIRARVPHVATRVSLTIEVRPGDGAEGPDAPEGATAGKPAAAAAGLTRPDTSTKGGIGGVTTPPVQPKPVGKGQEWRIAAGRKLPHLLVVTSAEALRERVGRQETEQMLRALRDTVPLTVVDDLPAGVSNAAPAVARVRSLLQADRTIAGVLLLGGYNVVPAQRMDAAGPRLRPQIAATADPDEFYVWTDANYGTRDPQGLPEVPVSRIPDGRSFALTRTALQARWTGSGVTWAGLRNQARPFAQDIYRQLAGHDDAALLVSAPTRSGQVPPLAIGADGIYLMLHGDFANGRSFWGEDDANQQAGQGAFIEAINVGTVQQNAARLAGSVIFAGCCWGALPVDTRASEVAAGVTPAPKTAEASIALSCLKAGANAFVGCTGAHYSPLQPPYQYYGGPFHSAFWQHYQAGRTAAEALLLARDDYLQGMPTRGSNDPTDQAIEQKIYWQYNCLGLGW